MKLAGNWGSQKEDLTELTGGSDKEGNKFTQGLNLLASIIYSRINILASIFWPCELDFRYTFLAHQIEKSDVLPWVINSYK